MPRPWTVAPGQYIYLCIPTIGLWTSHPFSVCWSDDEDKGEERTTIYLLIRRRSGFTNMLAQRVINSMNSVLSVHAMVEGPYGGIHSLDSYATVLLFAGGIGITHHLRYISHLVRSHKIGVVALRRITLVWAIRSPSYLEWFDTWMGRVFAESEKGPMPLAARILVYLTGSCDISTLRRSIGAVEVFTGRPIFDELVRSEVENQIGAMGVVCCGSRGFSDDVRRVCRNAQGPTRIDLFEESFNQ